jgi:hypothetical protein
LVSGVVDEDIELPALLHRAANQRTRENFVANVAFGEYGSASGLFDPPGGLARVLLLLKI